MFPFVIPTETRRRRFILVVLTSFSLFYLLEACCLSYFVAPESILANTEEVLQALSPPSNQEEIW